MFSLLGFVCVCVFHASLYVLFYSLQFQALSGSKPASHRLAFYPAASLLFAVAECTNHCPVHLCKHRILTYVQHVKQNQNKTVPPYAFVHNGMQLQTPQTFSLLASTFRPQRTTLLRAVSFAPPQTIRTKMNLIER